MIIPYLVHILILIGIYAILAVSLNLALGYSGLLNLGHIALFGIGAYSSAILNSFGIPFIFSFILAGFITGIFGVILVFCTKTLKGDYYALASLGFAFVVYSLFLNFKYLTNGPLGITGIKKPNIFGFVLNENIHFLIFVIVICIISVFVINKIVNSGFGKLLGAMRDNELGLRILGKNTLALKYETMFISGFFAGISGSLFAHYIGYIEPNAFYLTELIFILTIVIIGGIASIKGSIISTFLIIFIIEFSRFLPFSSSIIGPARQIVYSIVLLIILIYKPRGLYGRIDLE